MLGKKLDANLTAGTKTYYLPFRRNAKIRPIVALMVRRLKDKSYQVGMAVCSPGDAFVKRVGRRIAFHRLRNIPLEAEGADHLKIVVEENLLHLERNRPGTVHKEVLMDLDDLVETLDEDFDRLENKASRPKTMAAGQ